MPSTKSPAENSGTTAEKYDGFTAEERAAMKEHAHEQKKTAARRGASRAEKEAAAEQDVLAKIADMPEVADRLRPEGADRGRRSTHRRPREEGTGLRPTGGWASGRTDRAVEDVHAPAPRSWRRVPHRS